MSARGRIGARRLAAYGVAAVGCVALLFWGFRPTPRLVDTEPVTRGHLSVTLEAEGQTRVVDRYRISAPIAGTLRRLELEVGDQVARGQVLAVLDALAPPGLDKRSRQQAEARVAAAQAELAAAGEAVKAAEASAVYAHSELTRSERLASASMVSRTVLDKATSDARRADAELASARHEARRAEQELTSARTELIFAGELNQSAQGLLELRSPVSGRILTRELESARVVQPGDPILDVGDTQRLEVEVDVLSADAVRITPGMRVWLERWGHPEPLEARVKHVEPTAFTKVSALGVEEQRTWVIVDIVAPHDRWARLGDGYRVNARFVLWEAEDVLRAPTSALYRQGEAWTVFVSQDGRARAREARVGHRGALLAEILGGLQEGEEVVVHPDREILDGSRIEARGGG